MSQAYSNPKRENDPHALPDVEVFYADRPDTRGATLDAMLAFLADYPDLVETRTWTEIRSLAERYADANAEVKQ